MSGFDNTQFTALASRQAATYSRAQVASKLGLTKLSHRTQIRQLRALADTEGLPLPCNPRFFKGRAQHGALRIGGNSIWDRAKFDEWLWDWQADGAPNAPEQTGARRAAPAKVHSLHEEMARRAKALGGT